jgi:hypothetical protein
MKFKLFMIVVIGLTFLSYMYSWYVGELVPAWQAAIWVAATFIHELDDYLTARLNTLMNGVNKDYE